MKPLAQQFHDAIITPVLHDLACEEANGQAESPQAKTLLLATAAQETHLGRYLLQVGTTSENRALGIYGHEPNTINDLYTTYLREGTSARRYTLLRWVEHWKSGRMNRLQAVVGNLFYATALCRLHYWRFSEPIPENLPGIFRYYKKYWNSLSGKATWEQFERNYYTYVTPRTKRKS